MRRLGIALIVITLVYNVVEGLVAILAGLNSQSVVLLSFGADSYLEVLAAGAVLWRLSYRDEESGERAEERALRVVGVTFLILAAAVVFQAVYGPGRRGTCQCIYYGTCSTCRIGRVHAHARDG